MSKRILSILMVMVMLFSVATTACGKKEDATEKEELKVETEEPVEDDQQAEEDMDDPDSIEAENESAANDGEMKTGDDILTEEDIQDLKDTIRDTVISEYIEPNGISVEEFSWPNEDNKDWAYMVLLIETYDMSLMVGSEMDISKVDSSPYSNPEIIETAFNGILHWMSEQGNYDSGYLGNVISVLIPYSEVISTIDITSK